MPHSDNHTSFSTPGSGIAGFGCGAILGVLFWIGSFFFLNLPTWVLASVVLICGILGYKFGDRFIEWFVKVIRWFP